MREYTLSEVVIKFLFGWMFWPSKTQKVRAFGEVVEVSNPISFDELDEQFGEGNWSLIAKN